MIDKEFLKLIGQVVFATGGVSLIGALFGVAVGVFTRPVPYFRDDHWERVRNYAITGVVFSIFGALILNSTGW